MGRKKQDMIEDGSIKNIIGNTDMKEVVKALDVEYKEISYNPLTKEEYDWLLEVLPQCKSSIKPRYTIKLWSLKNKIENKTEPRPCTCKSSANLWLKCINILNLYIENTKPN